MTRVTNNIMMNDFYNNYKDIKENLNEQMNRLATGKKFNQISEAPLDATKALKLKTRIKFNEKYASNAEMGIQWLQTTDEALGDVSESLQRARDLAVQGANDATLTTNDMKKMATELKQIRKEVIEVANTQYGGRYIFNGTKTKIKPYEDGASETEADYLANGSVSQDRVYREISQGIKVDINTSGQEVGADTDGDGVKGFKQIFADLQKLGNGLESGDADKIQEAIGNIDQHMESVLSARASVGARQQRLDSTQSRLNSRKINYDKVLSDTQDVDIAKAITNLKMEENVYRAALATGGRILQPSLVKFL